MNVRLKIRIDKMLTGMHKRGNVKLLSLLLSNSSLFSIHSRYKVTNHLIIMYIFNTDNN